MQINILPQWDRSQSDNDTLEPFAETESGGWDFSSPNEAYFTKAKLMVEMASEKGVIPVLVLLWCNYVKGTWGAERLPGYEIPQDAIRPYVRYICELFGEFNPIFLVSGDTDLKSQETIDTYLTALRAVKEFCPDALTAFHLNPPTDLPEQAIDDPGLDFYMYQSGHGAEQQSNTYALAERFTTKSVQRPVINGEPCYEGHGFGNSYGRFSAFHVRRAIWQSLLSGAKAGFTYGAHGIWSWHEEGQGFPNPQFSSQPYPWRIAMHFQGAWDCGFIKWIFETYHLFDIEPRQDLLKGENPEIRLAASPDIQKAVLYIPYNAEVRLSLNLDRYECTLVDLEERFIAKPEIEVTQNGSAIKMHPFTSDVLIIGKYKNCT